MNYYYFEDREGLYRNALGDNLSLRETVQAQNVADLDPIVGLCRLTQATFDSHANNPQFMRFGDDREH
ncbi:MAG: hypothetical protein ACKVKF_15215 [Rhodobacterales bacterium]|uniref:hypothetical protein n=1 Tax=Puniceibacterium antarcticum TaxID=1206336 RepID=UPI00117B8C94|nr:hypothetical protein [Puniceibacterium antarcticum]